MPRPFVKNGTHQEFFFFMLSATWYPVKWLKPMNWAKKCNDDFDYFLNVLLKRTKLFKPEFS